jgi:hypothetical protein
MDGFGDRLSYLGEYLQMNSYLYSIGLRHYPSGTGFGLTLGYDFNKTPRGFGPWKANTTGLPLKEKNQRTHGSSDTLLEGGQEAGPGAARCGRNTGIGNQHPGGSSQPIPWKDLCTS